ncbi:MAG: tRNA-dihydrouridine synthase family protein [Deltaproteobacteria bacterium]|nr:tRNA-dihydrouridine synthase family protein [Deltaproteobacteria bacterium]
MTGAGVHCAVPPPREALLARLGAGEPLGAPGSESWSASIFLALAPMEGISDFVVRSMLSELGGMDICVTEFIRVTDRPTPPAVLRRACPELDMEGRTDSGVPVLVQLLGSDPTAVAESARTACDLGALGIDLNFGCPARRVNGHHGGAAVLREPRDLERIVAATRSACPARVSVSAKVRLGWDDPDDILDIAHAAEVGGADWLTIHGRTKTGMYTSPADWRRIGLARAHVSIPVVANGDIFSPDDLVSCAQVTGCSAFMLGRGAFQDPNLFRWIRGLDRGAWVQSHLCRLLLDFIARANAHHGPGTDRLALNRLKQWVRSMGQTHPEMYNMFSTLKHIQTLHEAVGLICGAIDHTVHARPSLTL